VRTVEVWIIGVFEAHTRWRWQKGTLCSFLPLGENLSTEQILCMYDVCMYYVPEMSYKFSNYTFLNCYHCFDLFHKQCCGMRWTW